METYQIVAVAGAVVALVLYLMRRRSRLEQGRLDGQGARAAAALGALVSPPRDVRGLLAPRQPGVSVPAAAAVARRRRFWSSDGECQSRRSTICPRCPRQRRCEGLGLSLDVDSSAARQGAPLCRRADGARAGATASGWAFAVIEPAIERMKTQRLCEIVGGTSLGGPSYRYRITQLGREHAGTFLDRNMYAGFAPVPFAQYRAYMEAFRSATRAPGHRGRRSSARFRIWC